MTQRWLTGWLHMPAWQRLGSFGCIGMLLASLLWFSWLRPAQRQQQQLDLQRQQQGQRYRQQLLSLQAMPALFVLQQQTERMQMQLKTAADHPFSLPALLSASGAMLEYWHPAGQGGELSLTLDWSQFILLLEYLSACQPVLFMPRFSLQREAWQLRLVMELTDED